MAVERLGAGAAVKTGQPRRRAVLDARDERPAVGPEPEGPRDPGRHVLRADTDVRIAHLARAQ